MNPKETIPGANTNRAAETSLAAIQREVTDRHRDNPEAQFEAYNEALKGIIDRRKAVIRERIRRDGETPAEMVNDPSALTAAVDEEFKRISATDVEVRGLVGLMRTIREAKVEAAVMEARQKALEMERGRLQSDLTSLESFRENLERLGVDTHNEDAEISAIRANLAELV